jgi:hypothetical protein
LGRSGNRVIKRQFTTKQKIRSRYCEMKLENEANKKLIARDNQTRS